MSSAHFQKLAYQNVTVNMVKRCREIGMYQVIQELIASYAAYQIDKRWLTRLCENSSSMSHWTTKSSNTFERHAVSATGRKSLSQVTADAFGIGNI